MKARIDWNGDTLVVDFAAGKSLAIELQAKGGNPSFFSESGVRKRPLTVGDFVGDMSKGGSCNAEVIEFSPHSHGTHTECIGHIQPQHQSVTHMICQAPTLMRIITVYPEPADNALVIAESALQGIDEFDGGALALRTLPNDSSKRARDYSANPDFGVLSAGAMALLSGTSLQHLLVDTPSIDHPEDAGLVNHKTWWGLNNHVTPGVANPEQRSITEMIFIADEIPDGDYWLDLQLPPLVSDAVPSRPIIYPVTRERASS